MTREEAMKKYAEKFGSFPYFLTMGISEADLVAMVEKSLDTGKEIEPDPDLIY